MGSRFAAIVASRRKRIARWLLGHDAEDGPERGSWKWDGERLVPKLTDEEREKLEGKERP